MRCSLIFLAKSSECVKVAKTNRDPVIKKIFERRSRFAPSLDHLDRSQGNFSIYISINTKISIPIGKPFTEFTSIKMEGPLYIQLVIDELRLSSHDLSSTKLLLIVDSVSKEYQYPFRDIFFLLSSKYTLPELQFIITSPKTTAEGAYKLKNLKLSDKFRVTLTSNKEIVGFLLLQMNLLENLNKEICKHCALSCDIITHTSKSAKKLANLENKIIENDLGLEISIRDLENVKVLEKQDLRFFKNLLLGAHEKIKALELNRKIEYTQNSFTTISDDKAILDYPKILNTLEQEIASQNKIIENLHIESKNHNDLYEKERCKNKEVLGELEGLKLEISVLKGEMVNLITNRRQNANNEGSFQEMIEVKKHVELELDKLRQQYKQAIEDFSSVTKNYEETIHRLTKDKEDLESSKEKALSLTREQKSQNDSLNSSIIILRSELFEKDAKIKVLESYSKQSLGQELIKENVSTLYSKIDLDQKRFAEFSNTMRKEKLEILKKSADQAEEIQKLKSKIEVLDSQLKQEKIKSEDQQNKLALAKKKTSINKIDFDISVELREIKTSCQDLEINSNKQMDFLIRALIDLSQKFLFQQRLISKLFKFIQDKDCEICILRNKLVNEQSGMNIYVPDKNDVLDVAMGEYINTRPNFLEVPFVRIEPGVYLFGSKIVKVKYQNNRIIMCMGGGFMSVDEFISIFTPIELEKYKERKKYDQSSSMKAMIQESLMYINNEGPTTPMEIKYPTRRNHKELSLNVSRDSSRGSISSPALLNHNRSLTRKNSIAHK